MMIAVKTSNKRPPNVTEHLSRRISELTSRDRTRHSRFPLSYYTPASNDSHGHTKRRRIRSDWL